MAKVQISKTLELRWLVHLDDIVVGSFMIVGDALSYAQLLECSPRIRREARVGAGSP